MTLCTLTGFLQHTEMAPNKNYVHLHRSLKDKIEQIFSMANILQNIKKDLIEVWVVIK